MTTNTPSATFPRPRGRPPFNEEPMEKVTLWMSEKEKAMAKVLGQGNVSEGIRMAVKVCFIRDRHPPVSESPR